MLNFELTWRKRSVAITVGSMRGVIGAVVLAAALGACAPDRPRILTQESWCEGFEAEALGPMARMSGRNRERLEAAQRVVAPSVADSRSISGLSLLGGYQEEMQRPRPDTATAAAYLAAASGNRPSFEMVAQVNNLLCVTTSQARAREIAETARVTQQDMLAAARR